MSSHRLERLQALFLDWRLEIPDDQREIWIAEQCGEDFQLADELRELLTEDERRQDPLEAGLNKSAIENQFTDSAKEEETPKLSSNADTSIAPSASLCDVKEGFPQIDGYEIIDVIDHGGMGVVYKARQKEVERTVALKVIRADVLSDLSAGDRQQVVTRFQAESRAAASLDHDHIVTVFEVGESNGRAFYSMRFVDGESLSKRIAKSPMTGRDAAELLEPIARAIHRAHEAGIIHRDLKPANILLEKSSGRPLVTDFGLAKFNEIDSATTKTGEIFGSPPYMPPEQARSALNATAQSDLYSLGATLYHMLTGKPPFQGASPLETLQLVENADPISPRELNPSVGRDLETICLKCLEKEPERRYATTEELADDLRRFIDGKPIHARPITRVSQLWRWIRRNPVPTALVGAVAVAAMAIVAYGVNVRYQAELSAAYQNLEETNSTLTHKQSDLKHANQLLENAREREETARKQTQKLLNFRQISNTMSAWQSRDYARAKHMLDAIPDEGRSWEWHLLNRLGGLLDHAFSIRRSSHRASFGTSNEVFIAASLDGSRIACSYSSGIVRIWETSSGRLVTDKIRGTPRKFRRDGTKNTLVSEGTPVAMNSNGTLLLTGGQTVQIWDANTGALLKTLSTSTGMAKCVAFSGKDLVAASGDDTIIRVWNAKTGILVHSLKGHADQLVCLSFSADAAKIVSSGKDKTVRLWDVVNGKSTTLTAQSKSIVQRLGSLEQLTISHDGATVAAIASFSVLVWDAESPTRPVEVEFSTSPESIDVSSDGKRIVCGTIDGTTENWDLESGRPGKSFQNHRETVDFVKLLPDNRVITVCNGVATVWQSEGEEGIRTIRSDPSGSVVDLAFHPDNSLIVIGDDIDGLEIRETYGRSKLRLPARFLRDIFPSSVAISPDGRRLVCGDEDGVIRIWDFKTQSRMTLRANESPVNSLEFISENSKLVTSSKDGSIRMWDLKSGKEIHESNLATWKARLLLTSPDGSRLAICTLNGLLQILDTRDWTVLKSVKDHQARIECAAFKPDGRGIAYGTGTGHLVILDFDKGTNVRVPAYYGALSDLSYHPDGSRIATCSVDDNRVRLWDTVTGYESLTYLDGTEYDEFYHSIVRFSPDGRFLAVGRNDDGQVLLFDVGKSYSVVLQERTIQWNLKKRKSKRKPGRGFF